MRILELILLFIAILLPQFILAAEVDGDEFAKATVGIASGTIIVAGYKLYKNGGEK